MPPLSGRPRRSRAEQAILARSGRHLADWAPVTSAKKPPSSGTCSPPCCAPAPDDGGVRTALSGDDRWLVMAYPSPPERPSAVLRLPRRTARLRELADRGQPGVKSRSDATARGRKRRTRFVGLLATPLLTARTDPALFAGILRHRAQLGDWTARLGYRLVIAGDGRAAAPRPRRPAAHRRAATLGTAVPPRPGT